MKKLELRMKKRGVLRGSGVWRMGAGKAPSANPNLPGRCPAVLADGHQPGGSGDKTSKLRNEPISKMQLSPDFTDIKSRFCR